jgi:tryptophanyl-tRNA synthetase
MVVTPWEVKGDIDYGTLIQRFGTQPLTEELKERIAKHAGYMHMQLRRNVYFSHRDLDWWLNQYDAGHPWALHRPRPVWRRPPRALCCGSSVPTSRRRITRASSDDRRREIPTPRRPHTRRNHRLLYDNALDVIACGVQPKLTHIFSDTDHIGHIYKLGLQVSKRITMSTVKAVFGFTDSDNIGLTWYPALQAMTCFLQSYREGRKVACLIPAAIDQDPYWRRPATSQRRWATKPPQIIIVPTTLTGGKMSAGLPESAIFTTDVPRRQQRKLWRHSPGRGDTGRRSSAAALRL